MALSSSQTEPLGAVHAVMLQLSATLKQHLTMDKSLAERMYGWKPFPLIDHGKLLQINAQIDHGLVSDALQAWYQHAYSSYTMEYLQEFCRCLRAEAKPAKPRLEKVAEYVENQIKPSLQVQSPISSSSNNQQQKPVLSNTQQSVTETESIKSTEDLLPYITPMTQYLRELGVALAISEESAAIVDGPGAARSKCLSILQLWLSCTARPTWTLLCQRLRKVDIFTNLVTTIEADHNVLSVPPTQETSPVSSSGPIVCSPKTLNVTAKVVLDRFENYRQLLKDVAATLIPLRINLMEKRPYLLIDTVLRCKIISILDENNGPMSAATLLLNYFEEKHNGDDLLRFCKFLRDESKEAAHDESQSKGLTELADQIESKINN